MQDRAGSSRMSCCPVLQREGLIQPRRIGHDLREAAERRRCQSQYRRIKVRRIEQVAVARGVTKAPSVWYWLREEQPGSEFKFSCPIYEASWGW